MADEKSDRLKLDSLRPGISNFYINSNISWFLSPQWKFLHGVIGDDHFFDLLTSTCLFLKLENGCLAQVAGTPVFYDNKYKLNKPAPAKPSQIAIARHRLFYGRPLFYSTTNKVYAIGLPTTHVLNRLEGKVNNFTASPPLYLIAHIFPHQHKLRSMFDAANGITMSYNRLMRDAEIEASNPHTPTRLKQTQVLFQRMLTRHFNLDYVSVLKRHCASKTRGRNIDMTQYMDDDFVHMSEHIQTQSQLDKDTTLATQMSNQSDVVPIPYRPDIKAPPSFQDLQCGHGEVKAFAKHVLSDIIPRELFGSTHNKLRIFDSVDAFISMRKYETLTLHAIVQGLQVNDFKCFYSAHYKQENGRSERIPPSEQTKVTQVVLEWIYWIFEDLLIPLLKNTFYVSDSSADRKRTYYFRHDDWLRATAPLLEQLSSSIFERATLLTTHHSPLALAQTHSYRTLQPSYVRLMPKETGVRPIVNLRKQNWVDDDRLGHKVGYRRGLSINHILRSAFDVLSYERLRQPNAMGASLLGAQEAFERLKEYKKRIIGGAGESTHRKFYLIKADIQCCFDTIDQQKLLNMLDEIIKDDDYVILKHHTLARHNDTYKRTFKRQAVPEYEEESFIDYSKKLSEKLRNTIIADQVVHPHIEKNDLLKLLKEHIMENLIKINNRIYRQATGIPQGSILSTILCSFFYGMLERNEMEFVQQSPSALLLRFIDDFLFITTDREEARYFLQVLRKGFPQYGAHISDHKTLVNFDISFDGVETINRCQRPDDYFPWCGILVNSKTLDVKADYGKTFETDIRNSFSVGDGCRIGETVVQKLTQSFQQHAHALYADCNFNSSETVKRNLYENYLVAAVKMGVFLTDVLDWKRVNVAYIQRVVENVVQFGVRYTLFKASTKQGSYCTVPPRLIYWLGYKAFERVLVKLMSDSSLNNAIRAASRKLLRGVGATVNKGIFKRYRTNRNLNSIVKHSLNHLY
ncbi:hypothetical protein E3P77_01177 [Wallemia ichthyophaga]|uniref:Telomerase reverse transcriptase n=1 Tax=Wallemia ichthyophaga TaxID=245174 RepID=A0A4T0LFH9_WALIC|nr:hypothetical protein E3P90_02183 [Wallemia ichthyophaga]TIB13353.1 hypothetical protein E3P93_02020 [Wallemia ichthyophaga]TIB22992.1 hypothetical protein E3P89_01791 [Wallemia ichthyophaga]TIB24337.1 hypothetical protein E3P88_02138 [Wallemia ichthyophaga]TIB68240.1 hypothetical protein E3P77_01177 [Wallemia ichthyophaga]